MLEELGIKDTQQNAERVFVRAELYPEDGDVFSPIDHRIRFSLPVSRKYPSFVNCANPPGISECFVSESL